MFEAGGIKYLEYDLQCAVARYLDDMCKYAKVLAWSHPPNEAKHKPQYRIKQKKSGMKSGEPDCIIYARGGKVIFVELKLKNNYLSAKQKDRHAILSDLGYSVYTVKSNTPQDAVNQVENILKQEGVLT